MKLIAYLFPEMGVLSLGMMLAMISGGIDLTVVAVADLSGILCCMMLKAVMPNDASLPVQILVLLLVVAAGLVIGGLCGAFSGTLISRIGIPAMVATLGAYHSGTSRGNHEWFFRKRASAYPERCRQLPSL